MKKIKNYLSLFLPLCLLISGMYYSFASLGWIMIDLDVAMKLSFVLLLVFSVGTAIIAPGLKKDHENFAIHFLALTTFQMLMAFGVIGFLAFQKIDNIKTVGLSFISFYITLLFIQSILLISLNRSNY